MRGAPPATRQAGAGSPGAELLQGVLEFDAFPMTSRMTFHEVAGKAHRPRLAAELLRAAGLPIQPLQLFLPGGAGRQTGPVAAGASDHFDALGKDGLVARRREIHQSPLFVGFSWDLWHSHSHFGTGSPRNAIAQPSQSEHGPKKQGPDRFSDVISHGPLTYPWQDGHGTHRSPFQTRPWAQHFLSHSGSPLQRHERLARPPGTLIATSVRCWYSFAEGPEYLRAVIGSPFRAFSAPESPSTPAS